MECAKNRFSILNFHVIQKKDFANYVRRVRKTIYLRSVEGFCPVNRLPGKLTTDEQWGVDGLPNEEDQPEPYEGMPTDEPEVVDAVWGDQPEPCEGMFGDQAEVVDGLPYEEDQPELCGVDAFPEGEDQPKVAVADFRYTLTELFPSHTRILRIMSMLKKCGNLIALILVRAH